MKNQILLFTLAILVSLPVFSQHAVLNSEILENRSFRNSESYFPKATAQIPGNLCNQNSPAFKSSSENGFILVEELENYWKYWDSIWVFSQKVKQLYNDDGNLIERVEYHLDTTYTLVESSKYLYYYEDDKLVEIRRQVWEDSNWENWEKQLFTYDEENNLTEEAIYRYSESGWLHWMNIFQEFENNNMVYRLEQKWNGSAFENKDQFFFDYDDNNNMDYLLWQKWNAEGWINKQKWIYLFDETVLYERLHYYWIEEDWFISEKYYFTNDIDGNVLTEIRTIWDYQISEFVNSNKDIFSYDVYGNQVKMLKQQWIDDYWLNNRKIIYYYLPADNEQIVAKNIHIDKPIEDFQTTEDDLNIEPGREEKILFGIEVIIDSVLHTSDGDLEFTLSHNGISQNIIYQAGGEGDNFLDTKLIDGAADPVSSGAASFMGIFKPENPLSVFLETDPAGIWTLSIYDGVEGNTGTLQTWGLNLIYAEEASAVENRSMNKSDMKLFPNPASSVISLQSAVFSQQSTIIKVYDLNGKKLIEQNIPKGRTTTEVNVSELMNGIYFYKITSGNISTTKKLIIQK